MQKGGRLVLTDGSVFCGNYLAEESKIITGEVVFSTAMCGYTEVLTDPSYFGQIVVLANPEIGNYGVNADDFQSDGIKVKALVVRNLSFYASSFRAQMTLFDWLLREQIPVLFGIDTRALISHLREMGSMMAAISSSSHSIEDLAKAAQLAIPLETQKLTNLVSVKQPQTIKFNLLTINGQAILPESANKYRVVVLDFGVKRAILRYLCHVGAELILISPEALAEEIWSLQPDGLFLSNGPGDPKLEKTAITTVRSLLGKLPIFGVCLGHQIFCQALGFSTYKLKYGHRGSNQPVKSNSGIMITAQNHGYVVSSHPENMADIKIDCNISDGTNEGVDLVHLFAFSVQFHPEGAPGPHDSVFYFQKFMTYIGEWKKSQKLNGYLLRRNHDITI